LEGRSGGSIRRFYFRFLGLHVNPTLPGARLGRSLLTLDFLFFLLDLTHPLLTGEVIDDSLYTRDNSIQNHLDVLADQEPVPEFQLLGRSHELLPRVTF